MNHRTLGIAAALALLGCGKAKQDCKLEADELARLLSTMDRSMVVAGAEHLVVRMDLAKAAAHEAPVIAVTEKGIVWMSALVDRAKLQPLLTEMAAKIRDDLEQGRFPKRSPPDPRRILLLFDDAAAWRDVVTVIELAQLTGFTEPELVFARTPPPPPPRTPIDDKLDAILSDDAGSKATQLAKLATEVIKSCPAMAKTFGTVSASESASDRTEELISAIGPSLVECNCDLDMAAFRSLMLRVMGNPHPTTVLPISLVPEHAPIAFPAATPWREASKRFTPDTKAIWATVAP